MAERDMREVGVQEKDILDRKVQRGKACATNPQEDGINWGHESLIYSKDGVLDEVNDAQPTLFRHDS